MMPQTLPAPGETTTDSPDLTHYICPQCWPDADSPDAKAICGHRLDDGGYWDDASDDSWMCVVCYDLGELPCSVCGY